MDTVQTWSAPDAAFADLDKDAAKFLFDSTEKRLKNLLETSDKTTGRAITSLTFLIPLIAFLLSALFKHYFGSTAQSLSEQLLIISWLSCLVCLIAVSYFVRASFPRLMHQMGREPKALLTEEFLQNQYYQGESQYRRLLIGEIEEFQCRISFMQDQSNRRVEWIKVGFSLLGGYATLCFVSLMVWALSQW